MARPEPNSTVGTLSRIRSLAFDLMGTCADWHTSICQALDSSPVVPGQDIDRSELAHRWRAGFFRHILDAFEKGEQSPDIDIVHRLVLDRLLEDLGVGMDIWDERERQRLVDAWHKQTAWPDAIDGIHSLKEHLDVVVLANGTTRLQLDIVSSAALPFHTLFSSQLLGLTKPDLAIYKRCIQLLDRRPEEVAMVAAHAYDLRAAAQAGMHTVYIRRDTEDPEEDMSRLQHEFDLFIDGRSAGGARAGLARLAEIMQRSLQ